MLRAERLEGLVEQGSVTPQALAFLEAAVRAGLNLLVAGGQDRVSGAPPAGRPQVGSTRRQRRPP